MRVPEDVPLNPGGSMQLAVEGAKRWWESFGRRELENGFGVTVEVGEPVDGGLVQSAAMMAYLCGRLEIEKHERWERFQQAMERARRQGIVVVGGDDPTRSVT